MKTKNIKGPMSIPARKPIPSQRLIRLDRDSGLPGMNTATAAGSPEQKTVQPPSTAAQASRPLTTAVPSEGLVSQRMRMVADISMPSTIRADVDGRRDQAFSAAKTPATERESFRGSASSSTNRPHQGSSTAVGVFTRFNNLRSRHATAGKLVNHVSNDAQLRSLTRAGACPISSRSELSPTSSRSNASPTSSRSELGRSCTPFHHAQFDPTIPRLRSIPTRFVFAEVRGFEMGEGKMQKTKFARIAGRVCAPANDDSAKLFVLGRPAAAKTFTRNNNRRSRHATAGKQEREGNHPAELRSCSKAAPVLPRSSKQAPVLPRCTKQAA